MYATVVSRVAHTVRHNDPGVTGGPRLYLRATVEINETKTGTRSEMRCFLPRGPSTTVSDFKGIGCGSRADDVASFMLVGATCVVLLSCCLLHGFELKRKRRTYIEMKQNLEIRKVDKDVIIYIKLSRNAQLQVL